jgi:hypothetical protein
MYVYAGKQIRCRYVKEDIKIKSYKFQVEEPDPDPGVTLLYYLRKKRILHLNYISILS